MQPQSSVPDAAILLLVIAGGSLMPGGVSPESDLASPISVSPRVPTAVVYTHACEGSGGSNKPARPVSCEVTRNGKEDSAAGRSSVPNTPVLVLL